MRESYFNWKERRPSLLKPKSDRLDNPRLNDSRDLLAQNLGVLKNEPVTMSWLHGDCKTDNFLLSGQLVAGIDIGLKHENAIEYDIAQFLNQLAITCGHPARPYLRLLLPRIEKNFLSGYLETGPSISHKCLKWIRLWMLLNLWCTTLDGRKPGLRRSYLNYLFIQQATRLESQLKFTP